MSGVEARICCWCQALQDRMDKVQKDVAAVKNWCNFDPFQQTEQRPIPVRLVQNPFLHDQNSSTLYTTMTRVRGAQWILNYAAAAKGTEEAVRTSTFA